MLGGLSLIHILLPIVNTVDDSDDFVPPKHRKDDDMPSIYDMPQSLKTAIKCFIMTLSLIHI